MRVEAVNPGGRSAQMVANLVIANKPQQAPAAQSTAHNEEQMAPPEGPRPLLPVANLEAATVGQDYSVDLPTFSGEVATSMTLRVDPSPPAGLAFADLGSGHSQISGKPKTPGSYAFEVVATNAAGLAGRMSVKVNVTPAPAPEVTAKAEAPKKSPTETPSAKDRAAAFTQSFDGGDCFLVKSLPSAAGGHTYLGVGDQLASFERFEESYRKEVGAEPQLSLRLIAPSECAALDVLRAASSDAPSEPRITLTNYRVGRNKPLSGTVAKSRRATSLPCARGQSRQSLSHRREASIRRRYSDVQCTVGPRRWLDRTDTTRPGDHVGEADRDPREFPLRRSERNYPRARRRGEKRSSDRWRGLLHVRQLNSATSGVVSMPSGNLRALASGESAN